MRLALGSLIVRPAHRALPHRRRRATLGGDLRARGGEQDDPLELVYDLLVCTSKDDFDFGSCETQTYRMDGWPNGTLAPVRLP